MLKRDGKLIKKIALFIAILFHVSGLIGILFTTYKNWFIQNTAANLLVMALLLIITQTKKNIAFYVLIITAAIVGFMVEFTGVSTGKIFGHYTYGNALGTKLFNVPVIIGINWLIVIYCTGMVTEAYENRMLKRINASGATVRKNIQNISFVIDAAFLAVFFDWVIEPVCSKLGYWQWQNNVVPFYNYVCWFITSALLLALFKSLPFNKRNIFAVHLFMIQLLFFLILRTFL